jgi:ABC-type uncharacterized transport system involved in gliding motility auxiliary subunit
MARPIRASKRKTLANAVLTTSALAAGLLLTNVIFYGIQSRLDLTAAGFFSLTEASKQLVAGLDEAVRVTAYFGNVPAETQFQQQYVESLLDRYADASNGMLSWKKIDPFEEGVEFQKQLKSDEQIDKLMWLSMVDDMPQQVPVYFHVQFKYLDKTERWEPPGRFTLEGLEYDLSSIIKRLAYPKKSVVVTTGFGSRPQTHTIAAILSGQYEVASVDLSGAEIDLSAADILIVNGPTQPVSESAQLAIEGHILAGKPTLFLSRGMSFQAAQQQAGMPSTGQPLLGMPAQSGLGPLLAHYGVKVEPGLVLDARASTAGAVAVGPGARVVRELFPLAKILANGRNDPLAGLDVVPVSYATRVSLVDDGAARGDAINAIRLARSSRSSYLRDQMMAITADSPLGPIDARRGPFDLGYALEGSFRRYFTGKPVPAEPASTASTAAPAEQTAAQSPGGTRIIVFGSADFVADELVALSRRHPMFSALGVGPTILLNMVDWLAQDQALVAARSKQAPPPIEPIEASTRMWIKYGNSVGVALMLLVVGLATWYARERRRRALTI